MTKEGKKDAQWNHLRVLIRNHAIAVRDDEMKGGGDPADVELIEARLKVAELELDGHIHKMYRHYEE